MSASMQVLKKQIIIDKLKRENKVLQDSIKESYLAIYELVELYRFQEVCNGIYPLNEHDSYPSLRPAIDKAMASLECKHDWVKIMANKAIKNGEFCTKCRSVRP